MRSTSLLKFIGGAACAILLLVLVYQVPAVHTRLAWRLDFTATYLRGVLYPAQDIPTPRYYPTPSRVSASQVPAATQAQVSGPADSPAPTLAPTFTPTPPPERVTLDPPKWEKQDLNNCGPATLAAYLRFYGWEGDQFTIDELVKPKLEDRNVNVEELAYFARTRAGWLHTEYRVGMDLDRLKRFMAAGIPVMIEETFKMDQGYWPNDDLWAGHYLLITGYDDPAGYAITQDSFYGANRFVSFAELDSNWKAFNRVLILLYTPEQEGTVKAILASDWDPDANRANALKVAETEAQANPNDGFAWFNQGANLVYFDRYSEAAAAFDRARTAGLPQRMFRYQFGPFIAYFHTGRVEDLLAVTEYALKRTANSEEALIWHGWAKYRQGDRAAAEADFKKALDANVTSQDARYALDFLAQN